VITADPVQTPAEEDNKGIMEQYATMIKSHTALLQSYSRVVVLDGYFMKKGFIDSFSPG
jgi:hypothetical protein